MAGSGGLGARRAGGAVLATAVALALAAASVSAHEGEETDARQAVLQAVALIVNTPADRHALEDLVDEAAEAAEERAEPGGPAEVDVRLLARASAALEAGDLDRTRALLERSIGARPDLRGTDVQPILHLPGDPPLPATGEQTGTSVVVDPLAGRGPLTRTDAVLLGVAAALGLAGAWAGVRTRPAHSVHRLRRLSAPGGAR